MIALLLSLSLQNVVEGEAAGRVADPVTLTEKDLDEVVSAISESVFKDTPEFARLQGKLARHVAEFQEGYPWKAFHNTLGISGYEAYFNHPDHLVYALSTAMPFLMKGAGEPVREFLKNQVAKSPPYAIDGFENASGRPREAYDVPEALRIKGRGKATSAFGVYAFWAYAHHADPKAVLDHWAPIKARMAPLLLGEYTFDSKKRNYSNDEAQKLNGDLAGLIGYLRLAKLAGEAEAEKQARPKALALLELRVNLERVNPNILEKTNSTTAHLHAGKLARYCDLVPPVAAALRKHTDGLAAERLRAFREARNGWYLAFGDRMIGGENYTNPPHFVHALFMGAAFVEQLPAEKIASFVDVPWCKGDFYFIEQVAAALSR